jgi:FeS assembly SUF system regulator
MLRISKLTDYGTLLMAFLASNGLTTHTAKDIAHHTHLSVPTVSKLLKLLAKGGLLQAHRGVKGGYSLSKSATEITLAQIIAVLEGNIGLTECSHHTSACNMETHCAIRGNWRTISDVIRDALQGISLAEMAKPLIGHKLNADTKTISIPVVVTNSVKTI